MTDADKQVVANYMGWEVAEFTWWMVEDSKLRLVKFDLNDAGLCAKKMQKHREDWDNFVIYAKADTEKQCQTWSQLFAWLYVADYFFTVFAAWLKEEKK